MEKGQIVELTIEDMSAEGRGIGKIYDDERGFAVFVQDTVVGDRAKVELTKVKKNYAFGRVSEMLELSQDRQESFCPHSGLCGGCVYSKLSYEAQLALKEKQVREKLVRLGGLTDPVIMPIIGMGSEDVTEEPFRYRNKASMPVSTGGLITQKGGIVKPVHEPRVGFYRPKSHDVVDCADCLLQSEPAMAAAAALRKFMEEDHITSYDPRWEKGLMRHMIVRTAAGTGEVMVILVINGKAIPNAPKLIEMLDEAIYNVPVYEDGPFAGVEFNLESVIVNINKSKNLEGQILGEECITIAGKPTITEEVGGLSFEISPLSFYQVNREQMVRLYGKALEYASLKGDETVLDLYCGVGTIGLFAAAEMNRKTAELNAAAASSGTTASGQNEAVKLPGRVIGIESVKGAVLDANRNATINGIVNARYICGKAEEELPKMVDLKSELKDESLRVTHADVVILDPPRAGCEQPLLEAVVKTAPERIVYVSCDPATLARDIKWLGEHGYEFKEATPCDMFPWTGHVETVVLLSRETNPLTVEVRMEVETGEVKEHPTYKRIQEYVQEKYG
ncbi:MAG: 23S rRNA (uracil(1939)-C(5))-methyltransferase RlmD, partial [Firmicutes bacterium]|nr:23S rRNA (uracil(1939)-C(5))-methyltransferase RlmD [Bacillota bacterium]